MAGKSSIEWCTHTWNPIVGCSVISPGCTNCYAMKLARRLDRMGNTLYAGVTQDTKAGAVWTGELKVASPWTLNAPRRWRKPRRIFVNSMSDLFHESLSKATIGLVFDVMEANPQHTYLVLTKRSEIMRDYFRMRYGCRERAPRHIQAGVSVEDQARKFRIDHLRQTPAAIRFLSCEPLLEDLGDMDLSDIDQVIVGGESGPRHRPMSIDWAEGVLDQCRVHGTAFFMKQINKIEPIPDHLMIREFP